VMSSHDLHVGTCLDVMNRMGTEGSAGRPCWASALTIGARVGVKDSVGAGFNKR
jgi:hypothetical protein